MIPRHTVMWWAPIADRRRHGSDGFKVRSPYHRRLRSTYRRLRRSGMAAADARDFVFYTLWVGAQASLYVPHTSVDDAPHGSTVSSIPAGVAPHDAAGRSLRGGADASDTVGVSEADGGVPAAPADSAPGPAPQHSMWSEARL